MHSQLHAQNPQRNTCIYTWVKRKSKHRDNLHVLFSLMKGHFTLELNIKIKIPHSQEGNSRVLCQEVNSWLHVTIRRIAPCDTCTGTVFLKAPENRCIWSSFCSWWLWAKREKPGFLYRNCLPSSLMRMDRHCWALWGGSEVLCIFLQNVRMQCMDFRILPMPMCYG